MSIKDEPINELDHKKIHRSNFLATFLSVVLLSLFVFFASQKLGLIPSPTDDKPWLMQPADELARYGNWGLPMFRFLGGGIEHVWMSVPGLSLSLAAFFKIFGTGLIQARSFNLLCATSLLLFIFLIGAKIHSRAAGLIATFVLAFDINFFEASRILRSDIPALTCAIAAFYFYLRSQSIQKILNQWLYGILAGFLGIFATLINLNSIYIFGIVLVWSLIEDGIFFYRSRACLGFIVGTLLLALPVSFYIIFHYNDFVIQWNAENVHSRGILFGELWRNISKEFERYNSWRSGVLSIATSESYAVGIFQVGIILSFLYLVIWTLWKFSTGSFQDFFLYLKKILLSSPNRIQHSSDEFVEYSNGAGGSVYNTGSLQRWMVKQGGWKRKLTIALQEIEEDSRPVTSWLDALGIPARTHWKLPRTSILLSTFIAIIFFTVIDTHKSSSYLPYITSWCSLCCGVALVDGIKWSVSQRNRSARRVLVGSIILVIIVGGSCSYLASSFRSAWRFYRWSRTIEVAPYNDLGNVLHQLLPQDLTPIGPPIHWLAFTDRRDYIGVTKRIGKSLDITASPYIFIADNEGEAQIQKLKAPPNNKSFVLLAELSNTLYGDIKVYYTGQDNRFQNQPSKHYYFLGGRKGYYTEEQKQSAMAIWLSTPEELDRIAKSNDSSLFEKSSVQHDGNRLALRIFTDVSNYNTRVRLTFPALKPFTLYRLQSAVRVAEGGCLIGARDRTGLWLTDPLPFSPTSQYIPVDIVFATNSRGDGELAISNRRSNKPAVSLLYLSQVELREIGPCP